MVAVNSGGTSVGADGTFTTAAAVPVRLHLGVASVGGRMRFTLAAAAATSFTVVSTTNLALPVSNWIVVGTMTEMSPGHYEYIEVPASTLQQCYYSLRFP